MKKGTILKSSESAADNIGYWKIIDYSEIEMVLKLTSRSDLKAGDEVPDITLTINKVNNTAGARHEYNKVSDERFIICGRYSARRHYFEEIN